eukprot:gene5180-6150_t
MTEQPRTISRDRLGEQLGYVDAPCLAEIKRPRATSPALSVVASMLMTMTVTTLAALLLCLAVGALVGYLAGLLRGRDHSSRDERAGAALDQRAADQAVVKEGLDRLQDQMRDLEHNRVAWQSQLHEQVLDMRH